MPKHLLRLLALLLALGLVAAACGGDDGGDEDDESTTTTEASDEDDEEEDEPDDTTTTTEAEDDEGDRDDAIGDFGDAVEDDLGDVSGTDSYGEYVTVTDDSGLLTVEVPAVWSDVDGGQGLFGPDIIASTDVQAWIQTYDVSGLEFQATGIETNQSTDEILDAVSRGQRSQCASLGRQPYEDPAYVGVSEVFSDCAGTETDFVWLAFEPPDRSYHGILGVQITNEADIEALERALATFIVST